MKLILSSVFIICVMMIARSQSPGGTSQSSLVWVKGNTGTTPNTGIGTLTNWNNYGTAGAVTVNGAPTFEEFGYNYNPKIHFNGDGNFLEHPGVIFGSIYAVVELEDLSRVYTHLSTWTNMCSGPHSDGTLHGGVFVGDAGFELTGYCPEFEGAGSWKSNGLTVGSTNNYTGSNQLVSAVATVGDLDAYGDRLLGGQPCLPQRDWLGDASEIIVLNGTSSVAERNQIESYLAIKYGITLDNSGGGIQGDYYATTGTTIWDATNAPSYHNNVIGLGREDSEALYQKQSHTASDDTRLYLSNLETTNATNSGILNDYSYILMGDNQGVACATATSNLEIPGACGLYSRIEKEWKVSRTSNVVDFNFDTQLSSCAILGSVNPSDLRLLIDDDGDFSNGGTACYANGDGSGVVLSYVNPYVTVSNISSAMIPDNSTRFITIASVQQITPLPIEMGDVKIECFDSYSVLNWTTQTELNNDYFTIERSQGGGAFELVEVIDGAGTSDSPIQYQWLDESRYDTEVYYKLSQANMDGVFKELSIISRNCLAGDEIEIYPNPIEEVLNFDAYVGGDLFISDSSGKEVLIYSFQAGINKLSTLTLSSGHYLVTLVLKNGDRQLRKLVKL